MVYTTTDDSITMTPLLKNDYLRVQLAGYDGSSYDLILSKQEVFMLAGALCEQALQLDT